MAEPLKFVSDKTQKIAEFDGLRGMALLMVVFHHYNLHSNYSLPISQFLLSVTNLFSIAVDFFFALSGFLLTRILIDHRESPNLLRVFFIRRFCRIVPVYYLLLISYALLIHTSLGRMVFYPSEFLKWDHSVKFYLLFLQNIPMALQGSFMPPYLTVTWSLAVEEQFYLFLPFFILIAGSKRLPYALAGIITVSVIARTAMIAFNPFHFPNLWWAVYISPFLRMDTLLSGAVAAVFTRKAGSLSFISRNQNWFYAYLAGFWALFFFWSFRQDQMILSVVSTAGYFIFSITSFVIILLVASGSSPVCEFLRFPLFTHFGKYSYFIYLFHIPALGLLHGLIFRVKIPLIQDWPTIAVTFLSFLIVWAAALVSWKLIERPAIRFGHRFQFELGKAGLS